MGRESIFYKYWLFKTVWFCAVIVGDVAMLRLYTSYLSKRKIIQN